MSTIASTTREHEIAQETAEYIAAELSSRKRDPNVIDIGKPAPTDVEEIKAVLLDGRVWISWLDDRVSAALNALHGPPVGDATFFVDGEDQPNDF